MASDISNGSAEVIGYLESRNLHTGTSQRGPWERTELVLRLEGNTSFPVMLCVELWAERAHIADQIPLNSRVVVGLNLSSREFNGRWYTSARGWRIAQLDANVQPGAAPQPAGQSLPQTPVPQPVDPSAQAQSGAPSFPTQDGSLPVSTDDAFNDLPF